MERGKTPVDSTAQVRSVRVLGSYGMCFSGSYVQEIGVETVLVYLEQ